jgi:hypothetical protein
MGNMFAGAKLNKIIEGVCDASILGIFCIIFYANGLLCKIQQTVQRSNNRNFFTYSMLKGIVEL